MSENHNRTRRGRCPHRPRTKNCAQILTFNKCFGAGSSGGTSAEIFMEWMITRKGFHAEFFALIRLALAGDARDTFPQGKARKRIVTRGNPWKGPHQCVHWFAMTTSASAHYFWQRILHSMETQTRGCPRWGSPAHRYSSVSFGSWKASNIAVEEASSTFRPSIMASNCSPVMDSLSSKNSTT